MSEATKPPATTDREGSRTGARPRILLADDHPVLRRAVGLLLTRSGYDVVAEVGDGEEAVRVAVAERPDLALIDRVMPRLGGIDAARRIAVQAPEVRVVIMSGQVGAEPIAEAGRAGASAFIAKTADHEQLLAILSAVRDGRPLVEGGGAGTTIARSARRPGPSEPAGMELLTPREREVLRLVADGHSSQGAAAILQVSARTIETHRQHIMSKLGIHSVAGLTRFVLDSGNL